MDETGDEDVDMLEQAEGKEGHGVRSDEDEDGYESDSEDEEDLREISDSDLQSSSSGADEPLYFSSIAEGKAYEKPRRKLDVVPNDDIGEVAADQELAIRQILNAFGQDWQKTTEGKTPTEWDQARIDLQWKRWQMSGQLAAQKILFGKEGVKLEEGWKHREHMAWRILGEVLAVHEKGALVRKTDWKDVDQGIKCSTRLEKIVATIRDFARVRANIVSSTPPNVHVLAASPTAFRAQKTLNCWGNATKPPKGPRKPAASQDRKRSQATLESDEEEAEANIVQGEAATRQPRRPRKPSAKSQKDQQKSLVTSQPSANSRSLRAAPATLLRGPQPSAKSPLAPNKLESYQDDQPAERKRREQRQHRPTSQGQGIPYGGPTVQKQPQDPSIQPFGHQPFFSPYSQPALGTMRRMPPQAFHGFNPLSRTQLYGHHHPQTHLEQPTENYVQQSSSENADTGFGARRSEGSRAQPIDIEDDDAVIETESEMGQGREGEGDGDEDGEDGEDGEDAGPH